LNINTKNNNDVVNNIIDIREYDVPYYIRVAIDNSIFQIRYNKYILMQIIIILNILTKYCYLYHHYI